MSPATVLEVAISCRETNGVDKRKMNSCRLGLVWKLTAVDDDGFFFFLDSGRRRVVDAAAARFQQPAVADVDRRRRRRVGGGGRPGTPAHPVAAAAAHARPRTTLSGLLFL